MRDFTCKRCGSHQLSYQRYVKSIMPVDIDKDGNISYCQPTVDYDDEIPVECGYICRKCGHQVYHAGQWLITESQLRWFLTTNPDTLAGQQTEFEEYLEEEERLLEERQEHYDEAYL